MKMFRLSLAVLLLAACTPPVPAGEQEQSETVSLVRLIATPEKFEGKTVRVLGYVHKAFESSGIYLHKDDSDHGLTSNGLWLDGGDCKNLAGVEASSGYFQVEGRFTAKQHGHLGLWPGALQDIKYCVGLP